MTKITLTLAAFALALPAAMPAQAMGTYNGASLNGGGANGSFTNGGGVNGWENRGTLLNGGGSNGTQESGTPTRSMSSDASAFTLRGVTLPAVAGIIVFD
jgi:hypothetical protein